MTEFEAVAVLEKASRYDTCTKAFGEAQRRGARRVVGPARFIPKPHSRMWSKQTGAPSSSPACV